MMQGSTPDSTASSSSECSLPSSFGSGVPAIFLSHSGRQKPFVEGLFSALRMANYSVFFDQQSLPKGSRFPDQIIKRSAKGCELGIVVLSEDFLTSKWRMLELEILVLQRGPKAKVLPLFYKLEPADLKSPENLARWREVWEKRAGAHDVVVKWGEAVKALNAFNGEVFIQGSSEASYIDRVVRNICKEVRPPPLEDLTPIKGRHRLAKEVAGQFDRAYSSRQCEETCIIGLHGLHGVGKTTMCKNMVNFYSVEYPGQCHHLEFPTTDGTDMPQIVQECKKALKRLTNLSERGLNIAHNFEQVICQMKDYLRQRDVFLAIDNVWENSLEAAKRILSVGFSANSKILLTSHSVQVLEELLWDCKNACVHPLPALEHDEAFQIFQDAFGEGDINSLLGSRHYVEQIVERFLFAGTYNALALKALGGHVREGCTPGDLKKNEDFLSRLLQQVRNEDLGTFEDAIRLSYDILPEHRKHIFLDIAVFIRESVATLSADGGEVRCADAHQWLSILYKDQLSETKIVTLIYELALDGLVQFETKSNGKRVIRVNDLFADLAYREASASSKFFINGRSNRPVEEIEWEKLERVIVSRRRSDKMNATRFIEKLQQQECRKLQAIHADHGNFLTGIDMHHMPSLHVLYLSGLTLRRLKNWSAASRLGIVVLNGITGAAAPYERIPGVSYFYKSSMKIFNLSFLIQLQVLELTSCNDLERIRGMDSLEKLQRLRIWRCKCLERLDGLSSTLKDVEIAHCGALSKLPGVSGLTRLERLYLKSNASMEEVGGQYVGSTLEEFTILDCTRMRSFPSLKYCVNLREVTASPDVLAVAAFALPPNLHGLRLQGGRWLPTESLETLTSSVREGLAEIQELVVEDSEAHIIELGCLSPLTNLKTLTVLRCLYLKEIRNSGKLQGLESLNIHWCPQLKKLDGFRDIRTFDPCEVIHFQRCSSFEDIHWSFSSQEP